MSRICQALVRLPLVRCAHRGIWQTVYRLAVPNVAQSYTHRGTACLSTATMQRSVASSPEELEKIRLLTITALRGEEARRSHETQPADGDHEVSASQSSGNNGATAATPTTTPTTTSSVGDGLKVRIGDRFPNVKLMESKPTNKVETYPMLSQARRAIVFGVPGAFTPGCNSHLPGYVAEFEKFKTLGVDLIVCIAVNDPWVLSAWGEMHRANDKVRLLSDAKCELTRALGLELDTTKVLGNTRSKRYAMIVERGIIKAISVEPENTGLTCSTAKELLQLVHNMPPLARASTAAASVATSAPHVASSSASLASSPNDSTPSKSAP